ncbi:MAG: hypothetical protein ACRDWD_07010 [Acidimicrobiia bacterium]
MDMPTPPRGSWQGDALVLQHQLEGMGRARYTLVVADRELTFSIENSRDGTGWTKFLGGEYQRVA